MTSTTIFAAIGGLVFFYLFVLIPLCVLVIIAKWKLFRKAGEPGWKCLIPGYNTYILFKIAKLKKPLLHVIVSFVYAMIVATVMSIVMTTSMILGGGIGSFSEYMDWFTKFYLLELAALLPIIVLSAIVYFKLAKAFGKGIGFGIGLMLFSFIFIPVLGFGKAEYVKDIPVEVMPAGVMPADVTPAEPAKDESGTFPDGPM